MSEQIHSTERASPAVGQPMDHTDSPAVRSQAMRPLGRSLHHGAEQASDLLWRLFRGFEGSLALRLWDGSIFKLGNAGHDETQPPFSRRVEVRAWSEPWSLGMTRFNTIIGNLALYSATRPVEPAMSRAPRRRGGR